MFRIVTDISYKHVGVHEDTKSLLGEKLEGIALYIAIQWMH